MLNLNEKDDFVSLLDILYSISRTAAADAFMNISDCETVKNNFRKQLTLLKKGFTREKGDLSVRA
jgi:hypothetical protein